MINPHYKCVIAAAWMEKYFGMRFVTEVHSIDMKLPKPHRKTEFIENSPLETRFTSLKAAKTQSPFWYIHPDSVCLLISIDGDAWITSGDPEHKETRIIQRGGIPFIWPEDA